MKSLGFTLAMSQACHFGDKTQTRRMRTDLVAGDVALMKEPLSRGDDGMTLYACDGEFARIAGIRQPWKWQRTYLSARYMPHWASRSTLTVESVRVVRPQEISDADIAAEGITAARVQLLWDGASKRLRREIAGGIEYPPVLPPRELWRIAWCLINGVAAYDLNPEVRAISFRRNE